MRRTTTLGRVAWAFAAIAPLALLATGCSEPYHGQDAPPAQPSPGAVPGGRETLTGVVDVRDDGCVTLDLGESGVRWVVWPDPGSVTFVDDDGELGDPYLGDDLIADGVSLTGTGALVDATALPGWDEGTGAHLAVLGRYCGADDLGVVVFDEVAVTNG